MNFRMIRWGVALGGGLLLAACGDPLSDVPRLSDVPVAEAAGQVDVVPSATSRAPAPKAAPRGGLLGFLGRRAEAGKADTPTAAPVLEAAAPAPLPEARTKPASKKARAPRPGAPDARKIPLGVTLPYGQLARVCGVPKRKLGKKVDSYPERGSKYTLYDSAPGASGAHSFFLTGFDDGCARQFTAALVIFGSPESYEQIHYGPSGETQPVSETDKAYEKVKSKVCRVRKGKPCGTRMKQLARTTVFVSVYERFGSNPRWKNILLHDGEVVAMDIKS